MNTYTRQRDIKIKPRENLMRLTRLFAHMFQSWLVAFAWHTSLTSVEPVQGITSIIPVICISCLNRLRVCRWLPMPGLLDQGITRRVMYSVLAALPGYHGWGWLRMPGLPGSGRPVFPTLNQVSFRPWCNSD